MTGVRVSPAVRHAIAVGNLADKIVTPRYEVWLASGHGFPVPMDIAFKVSHLLSTPPRNRAGSFSASASGKCERRQVYSYLGAAENRDLSPAMARRYASGTYSHLRMQVAFLMAGIIDNIEYPMRWLQQRTMGTMDGIGTVPDDHPHVNWRGKLFGLEIKTTDARGLARLRDEGPEKFTRQVTRYFTMSGVDLFVIFAESRNDLATLEWVVEPDPALVAEDRAELARLNAAVEHELLPQRVPECRALTGETFRFCPYGTKTGVCARLTDWESAQRGE